MRRRGPAPPELTVIDFPEPTTPRASRSDVVLEYLDFFRSRVLEKVAQLPPRALRTSSVPSGWTPLQLVRHLTFVERRWLDWGFEGRDIGDPWADERDQRWFVADAEPTAQVLAELRAQGERTRAVVAAHDLDDIGRPGPRWRGAEPASLERVLLHLLQEYARHLGQLDIVAELAGADLGE